MTSSDPEVHFIFAAPFSGARRLMRALNRHPQVCATELQLFGNYFDPRPRAAQTSTPRITFDKYVQSFANHFHFRPHGLERPEFIEKFFAEYVQFVLNFTRELSGKPVLVDTIVPYPGTSRRVIDEIEKFFPTAKIVYLMRDGRDVVTEATFDTLAQDGHGTDRYAYFVENRPNVVLNRFFDDQALAIWAANWKEAIAVSHRLNDRALQIDYRQIELHPNTVMEQLTSHLGLEGELPAALREIPPGQLTDRASTRHLKENFLKNHADELAHLPLEAQLMKCNWKMFFTQQDGRLFQETAGGQLKRAGYETQEDWMEQLPQQLALQSA